MTKTICFVSPHPDDIELFCGGALLHHYQQGDHVHILMVTNGENSDAPHVKRFLKRNGFPASTLGAIRQQEALQRYELLPLVNVIFMGLPDGHLNTYRTLYDDCNTLIQPINPDLLYLPEMQERSRYTHEDHLHLSKTMTELAQHVLPQTTLRYYHSTDINLFLNVSPYLKKMKQALSYYQSQRIDKYSHEFILQNYYGWIHHWRAAEGYREVSSVDIPVQNSNAIRLTNPESISVLADNQNTIRTWLLYCLCASIATAANISLQLVSLEPLGLLGSIGTGVIAGTVVDDLIKPRIWYNWKHYKQRLNAKTNLKYIGRFVATLFVFLGVELTFDWIFKTDEMRYVGGVIGCVVAYGLNYYLDKRHLSKASILSF